MAEKSTWASSSSILVLRASYPLKIRSKMAQGLRLLFAMVLLALGSSREGLWPRFASRARWKKEARARISLPGVVLSTAAMVLSSLLLGCGAQRGDASQEKSPALIDSDFLTQHLWNDGKAEITFYEVEYLGSPDPGFIGMAILVKQEYNKVALGKPDIIKMWTEQTINEGNVIDSFQWGFVSLPAGDLRHRSIFLAVAQRDLRPLNETYSQSSLEGNSFLQLSFLPNGSVRRSRRGDRYNEADLLFEHQGNAYPVSAIPLLVRAMDFSVRKKHIFKVLWPEGSHREALAILSGAEDIKIHGHTEAAEKIIVRYTESIDFPAGLIGKVAPEEHYWRSIRANRQILRIESTEVQLGPDVFSYRLSLIEELRSAWWQEENFRERLTHRKEIFGDISPSDQK